MTAPAVSVCILAGHSSEQLRACLASLRAQMAAPEFELLVGGLRPLELVKLVHEYFPAAQVCDIGQRLPGAARNPLIERARGELLLFLDDDVIAPTDLLRNLVQIASSHPGSGVFGGPNQTPLDSSTFQSVQGAVLSSLMGSGPVSRRYGARHACFADERWFTLCNLAVRRKVMSPFISNLVCAEENALLTELHSRGETMRYDPCLRVSHARRSTWRAFARQMFKYGRGRGELVRRQPTGVRLAYLAPTALLLYLALALVMVSLGQTPALWLSPGAAYGLLLAASGVQIASTLRSSRCMPLAAALTLTVHLCYGAGLIRGLVLPGGAAAVDPARWATGPRPRSMTPAAEYVQAGGAPLDREAEHGA